MGDKIIFTGVFFETWSFEAGIHDPQTDEFHKYIKENKDEHFI